MFVSEISKDVVFLYGLCVFFFVCVLFISVLVFRYGRRLFGVFM